MKRITLFINLFLLSAALIAQDNNYGVKGFYPQTISLRDSTPVILNGLKAWYEIHETDLDSKKDNQSRYKIYFYVTNISTEVKIMYQNAGFLGHAGPISSDIAIFNCKNATGARFTNKIATIQLQPCYIPANVEDIECSTGKKIINRRSVNIGYWIKPGETVSKSHLMYVPQNEKPDITITFYSEVANQTGSLMSGYNQQLPNVTSFVKIKNFSHNTYLNNQNGPLVCSLKEQGWWSAEWEIIPVEGTDRFLIRNHWKNNYISSASPDLLSDDANALSSQWMIQETEKPNMYYIRNVANNARLFVEHGLLQVSNNYINSDLLCKWVIEQ